MFDVEACENKRAIWIRFWGELSEEDFARLDALGRDAQGSAPYDVIFDMTRIEQVRLATDFVAKRGELPQAFPDRARIYVVPQDDLKLLVRLYAAYQAAKGWRPPVIVQKVEDAFDALKVSAAHFRPVALSGAEPPARPA